MISNVDLSTPERMQFTPLGPWGVGASAGSATAGLKGDSGRVADPKSSPR